MPRPKLSFRISLSVALPVLVVLTGGLIAWRSFAAGQTTIDQLAHELFRQVATQTVARARSDTLRAVPAVELAQLLVREVPDALTDSQRLGRLLTAVMKANPEFSWLSYGAGDGSFTGAARSADGGLRLNHSEISSGMTQLTEYDVTDNGWTARRTVQNTGYDPRQRPYYLAAEKAHRRVWTAPYIFYDETVPGITCALPYLDQNGSMLGVFSVDFDLNQLSKFLASRKFSPGGRVILLDQSGALVAHPTVRAVERTGLGTQGKLLTYRDLTDLQDRAFFAAVTPGRQAEFTFSVGGERWRGLYAPFQIDDGLKWIVCVMAPESDFFAKVQHANRGNLAISLVALIVAALLGILLSGRIAKPLEELAAEMDKVGKLELQERPARASPFVEIQAMDDAVLRMKSGLRSFASFVPRDLVRTLLASGREAVPQGEVRELTLLFADIEGFTSLAEQTEPNELVRLLGGYFDEATRIIAEHDGTVDKFIGDGIMAMWGAPAELEEHAVRACQAALKCQRSFAQLRKEGVDWAVQLKARFGVASGDALVGTVGSSERLNYTALGDAVNLAARLEGLNKRYGTTILISESTFTMASERIVARPVDIVAVKGRSRGSKVYEVLALTEEHDTEATELAELCESALRAYVRQEFGKAAERFRHVLKRRPGDAAAEALLERCEAYSVEPPTGGWTGVNVMEEK